MPLLRGCCSFDLQIGTKIIGILFLIFNLVGFFVSLLCFVTYMVLKEALSETAVKLIRESLQQYEGNATQDQINEADKRSEQIVDFIEANVETVKILLLIAVCQQLIDVACSSCLIHGIRKNRRGLLLPWVASHCLYVVVELALLVLYIVLLVYVSEFYAAILPSMAILLLWMALHIYCILVVISQFQALGLIRMHDEMCMK